MTVNARQALSQFVSALEVHLEAVAARRGPDDAAVDEAYEAVAIAFERYEDVLESEHDESLPLVIDDDSDFDADDAELDDADSDLDDDDSDIDDEDIVEFDLNSSDA